MSAADQEHYTIVSGDHQHLTITKTAASLVKQIDNLLAIAPGTTEFPLEEIHSIDLKEIIDWCEYHAKAISGVPEADIMKFDQEFITRVTKDNQQHLRLISATDSLIIPPLFLLLIRALDAKLHNKP